MHKDVKETLTHVVEMRDGCLRERESVFTQEMYIVAETVILYFEINLFNASISARKENGAHYPKGVLYALCSVKNCSL